MFDLWRLVAGAIGFAGASMAALAAILRLWKLYGQQLKDKDEAIQKLQRDLDPGIAIERDQLRGKVAHLQDTLTAVRAELEKERIDVQRCHGDIASWKHQYNSIVGKLNDYARIANKNKRGYDAQKAKVNELAAEVENLKRQIDEMESQFRLRLEQTSEDKDAFWTQQLEKTKDELNEQLERAVRENRTLHEELASHKDENESHGKRIQELDSQLSALVGRHQKILSREGRIWERPVAETATRFVPLSERKAPIVSILNLKGGVGKTTITANLAALLGMRANDRSAKRPLVVDLDYQRSLTQLCCTGETLRKLHERESCVQHFFLSASSEHRLGKAANTKPLSRILLDSVQEVYRKRADLFSILACSEVNENDDLSGNLDDTEMHLFAEWLLDESGRDFRLMMREALHAENVQSEFSHIFLDCPPRLSLSCINALAASDFVLIPVILDQTSAISVPLLLKKIRRLRAVPNLFPSLRPLGIVANKVDFHGNQLLKAQKRIYDMLPAYCQEAFGEPVPVFDAVIRLRNVIGAVAEGVEPEFACCSDKTIREWFDELLKTIEERIQDERKNAQSVSAEFDPSAASKSGIV